MNRSQQDFAYQIAKSVRDAELSKKDGIVKIHQEIGLNISSARYVIEVFIHMSKGEIYTRALNASDSDYLLEKIASDESVDALRLALQAFRLHIEYREGMGVIQKKNREILYRYEQFLAEKSSSSSNETIEMHTLILQFEERVRASLISAKARRERLRSAPKRSPYITRLVKLYPRNPDVVAETLFNANGICGSCQKNAPFHRDSDGSPYLEVHHKIPLSEGGDDTVENAIALCPTCHRSKHFGAKDRYQFYFPD